MAKQHGITSNTVNRMMLDAGAAWVNYSYANARRLGATRGGSTFSLEEERRQITVDGVVGDISNLTRIVTVRPMITFNLLEHSLDNLKLTFPGAWVEETSDYNILRRTETQIRSDSYLANLALLVEVSNQDLPAVLMVKQALVEGNPSFGTQDQDETVLQLSAKGHYSLEDPTTQPWEIWWPANAV